MMLYVKIPMRRVGVLIGENGETKKKLEDATGVKVVIDSENGEVTIDEEQAEDPSNALTVQDIVKAIGRGFSEERAFRLLEDDIFLRMFDVRDFAGKNAKRVRQVRARLIGTGGKTRRLVEELTGVDVSIYGNTVGLIGDMVQLGVAEKAVEMLMEGSKHAAVYRFMEGSRASLRIAELGFD
ncbi:MAG: KH domain-containing protein [Candidatus Thermoplasmatota archaeon]|nr:KH domain-containing protein [Candidatus Thermoplasmatota archaeon]MCJ2669682.1 KH domain-containing protein [Candidatus Thermoplasmatota archaeon]